MVFEFNNQFLPQNSIDIDRIGEFAIECSNEQGFYYFLVVKTSLGTTTIASCGPLVPDVVLLPNGYETSLIRIKSEDSKIEKEITKWLNDRKKCIIEARQISIDDALDQFVDLGNYLKNYSDEVY